MGTLSYIIWTFDPELFTLPNISYAPRWYGILFALGFIISQQIIFKIFLTEKKHKKDVDTLTGYMVVATVIGARLGHCLFYNPSYYLSNPIEILKIYEGGLASHGAAIGILVGIYLFCKKKKYPYFWMVDRVVIVVALTGSFIRLGNLLNSEMEGTPTHSKVGIVYARTAMEVLNYDKEKIDKVSIKKGGELTSNHAGTVPITPVITYKKGIKLSLEDKRFIENRLNYALRNYREVKQHIDFGDGALIYKVLEKDGREVVEIAALGVVRHAAQVYESVYAFLIAIILFLLWYKKRNVLPRGFNTALFMIILWSLRFGDEFFKMNQEDFEEDLVLNMGQILSIPMVLIGIILMIWIYRNKFPKMSES